MRRINVILSAICALLALASCENGHNNNLPNNPEEQSCYRGTMIVDQNDGTNYTQTDVEVDYEIMGDKLNFVMYKVKFATGMPLKLDMVVEGVDYVQTAEGYALSGEDIIPYAMGGPFEKFIITKLTGTVTAETMTLSFMCGDHAVEYSGEN